MACEHGNLPDYCGECSERLRVRADECLPICNGPCEFVTEGASPMPHRHTGPNSARFVTDHDEAVTALARERASALARAEKAERELAEARKEIERVVTAVRIVADAQKRSLSEPCTQGDRDTCIVCGPLPILLKALADLDALSITLNQCDGCARGLRVDGGNHIDGGRVVMGCTADRYTPKPTTGEEG